MIGIVADSTPEPQPQSPDASPVLRITDLSLGYRVGSRGARQGGEIRSIISGLSVEIAAGEAYGLVGESGCGKSSLAHATIGYLPDSARTQGSILVAGTEVLGASKRSLRSLWRSQVSMVYQNPAGALNPVMRIRKQLAECFEEPSREQLVAALEEVRIRQAERVLDQYPHQLSGGMQQRVVIAMALARNPSLLIMDEPTTGLDATVEREIISLIRELQAARGTAVLFISHNLRIVSELCQRVGVIYAGRIVEQASASELFEGPKHPYTGGLMAALPDTHDTVVPGRAQTRLRAIPGSPPMTADHEACTFAPRCPHRDTVCDREPQLLPVPGAVNDGRGSETHLLRCHFQASTVDLVGEADDRATAGHALATGRDMSAPLLRVNRLFKTYGTGDAKVVALNDVSLEVFPGRILGLVGESGSGKSTLAKCLIGVVEPDDGAISLAGETLAPSYRRRSRDQLRSVRMVFQNPTSALNRRKSVAQTLLRSLRKMEGASGSEARSRLDVLLRDAQLPKAHVKSVPSGLSGGLKQRVAIARALAGKPELIICDEPTSALDVSVQAAILNLLTELRDEQGVALIFVSHDLNVVRHIADEVAVLYHGELVEHGPVASVMSDPQHPYTQQLLTASGIQAEVRDLRTDDDNVNQPRTHYRATLETGPDTRC